MEKPFVIILVGHPLTGKSTWIRNNYPTTKVVSRDNIVLELSNSIDYNTAFDSVDHKEVDKVLKNRLLQAGLDNDDVIIDMTHMTSKRRKSNLLKFTNHKKIAIVFPNLSDDEIIKRNQKRTDEQNKSIPLGVIKDMISQFQPIADDEGFDEVMYL